MSAGHRPPVTESDLLAYVDGQLDESRRAEVEAHLARMPADAERIAADLSILAGLRRLFAPGIDDLTRDPAADTRRRPSWLRRAAPAIMVATLAFGAGWLTADRHADANPAPLVGCDGR